MRGPQPPAVALSPEEWAELALLARAHQTPQQVALRARLLLAAGAGANNAQIARQEGVTVDTVRLWRTRWLGLHMVPLDELTVADRLEDAPRPGGPCTITAEQVSGLIALACEAPSLSARPISHWSGRELADEAVKRGLVEHLSPRHAGRLLKRGPSNRIGYAIG